MLASTKDTIQLLILLLPMHLPQPHSGTLFYLIVSYSDLIKTCIIFRFGHTIINPTLFRLGNDFMPIKQGHIALHKAFFTPELVLTEGGIDPLLRGLFASPLKHPMSTQLLNMELIEKLFMKGHEVVSKTNFKPEINSIFFFSGLFGLGSYEYSKIQGSRITEV